jgi:peroxiredoxin
VANFELKEVSSGRPVSLYGFAGKKAVVLFFSGTDCPVAKLYLPRLAEMSRTYKNKGVAFVIINSNAHEPRQQVAEHAKSHTFELPVLKDEGNVVADQLLVERTCEALLLDGAAVLRYRGAVDDQYGLGTRKEKPSKNFMIDALDAVLASKPVETSATSVVGCPIDRAETKVSALKIPKIRPAARAIVEALEEKEEKVEIGRVDYAHDVAPILQAKCQSCHRPKQIGPFTLLSYDDARRWAGSIREVVDDRRMPPWHADPRYGRFENDRSLSSKERATLLSWVDQGMPLGNPQEIPAPRRFPDGWTVGEPDVIFSIPEQTIRAQGVVPYQYFRVPSGFTEDKWVQSVEPRPGDRSVVHHIVVFLDDKASGRREHLGGYAPGDLPSVYTPGIAKRIPAGSDLVFQLHYTPTGKIRTDRSRAGFIFAKSPPVHRAITRGVANPQLVIEPGEQNKEVQSRFEFREDAHLLSFMPHMHLRGKDFLYTAVYPDGHRETLLSVPAYDFAWQSYYRLAEPKAMPKGTVIECVAHFDNSANNPANPDPTAKVRWGDQTWEEMMIGYIDYYFDAPISSKTQKAERPNTGNQGVRRLLRAFSANAGGAPKELVGSSSPRGSGSR